eukprot:6628590-Pyramimonas_sp.AAC.1
MAMKKHIGTRVPPTKMTHASTQTTPTKLGVLPKLTTAFESLDGVWCRLTLPNVYIGYTARDEQPTMAKISNGY